MGYSWPRMVDLRETWISAPTRAARSVDATRLRSMKSSPDGLEPDRARPAPPATFQGQGPAGGVCVRAGYVTTPSRRGVGGCRSDHRVPARAARCVYHGRPPPISL